MKTISILFFFLCMIFPCMGQQHQTTIQADSITVGKIHSEQEELKENEIYKYGDVDEVPEFPGGDKARLDYIRKNTHFPVYAGSVHIQGRVICRFVINEDGTVSNVEVIRGIDKNLDKEAIRVITEMPRWNPGKRNGNPVKVEYICSVVFRLE